MYNICVVGCGAIAPNHINAINKTTNAQLYAVCDTNLQRLDAFREKYGVLAYSNFDEMLNDGKVDAVHILTPHYLHFEMIKKALKCGKKVVCEKPVVMTQNEFEMLKVLDKSGEVCVVMQNRLNPCMQKLKELSESGEYGRLKAVKGVLTWARDESYYKADSWRGKLKTEGGGVLINQAIHTLDLLIYIAGNVKEVTANTYNYSLKNIIEVEDTVFAYLNFECGAKGIFTATNAYGENSSPLIEFVYENTVIRCVDDKLYINGSEILTNDKTVTGKKYWGNGHETLIKRYYDEAMYFNIKDIENTMNTMFAIYKSEGETICL